MGELSENVKAIDVVKQMVADGQISQDVAENYFPELKESEDERMVKFIKNQLFNIKETITENYELDAKLTKAIDWLEKQGNNNMGISEATKQKLEDNLNKALEKETPESCNEFLDEQGEQNFAWSEKDESILNQTLFYLGAYKNGCSGLPVLYMNECISWLKSLRPQNTWRPSEEQMKALNSINVIGSISYPGQGQELINLYQDLKKLKG